jgi:ankyrin repeat protein
MKRALAALLVLGIVAFSLGSTSFAAGRPPVVDAAKNGDHETLRSLIQKGTNVNSTEGDGTTALHWASYHDDLEAAELLIRAGAKVNAANDLGATPLWTACQNGSEAMVRRLLTAGANPNAKLLVGETSVMLASRVGNAAVVELLLAKGADPNARAARGQTALMWAVSEKHPDVVKVLLAHHADVHVRSEAWSDVMAVAPHGYLDYNRAIPHGNETPLLFAARIGDLDSAKLLIGAGANVNDEDAWGVSAAVLAAHSGFTDLLAFLLDKGADPNAVKAGFTALHEAIMRRDDKMAGALLAHGANPNTPLQTWTPTRRSSRDYNFEPELVGATPFWLAARFAEPEIMRLLIKHGADPLFVHHSEKVVDTSAAGARGNPFEHRKETLTALMAACGMGGGGASWVELERSQREALVLDSVKLLVELGVDVNAINTDGRTALDGARTLKFESVISYLQQKGAKAGTPARGGERGERR